MKHYIIILFTLFLSVSHAQNPDWIPSVLVQADHYYYVQCHDGLGRAEAFVTGGIPPFEYTWFDYYGNVVGYGLVLDSAPPSPDGLGYFFEVRKDTMPEGTGAWFQTDLLNPDSLVIEFNTHVRPSGHHISAPDSSDGQITATVYGGVSGYSYEWSNGSHTSEISNLSAGTYTLTVTDFIGCQKQKSVTLTEPHSPLHVVSISSPSINGYNISENGKPNGKINLVVNGGAPPYKIRWFPLGEVDDKNPDTLWARQYSAEITDTNGVKVYAKISLTEPFKLQLNLSPIVYPTCSDCSNGSITAVVTGGVTPYTYEWSNGQTTATISGLASGEYVVKVTDKNGAQLKDGTYLKAPESNDWSMRGNGNITSADFIGTTNNQDLVFKTDNTECLRLNSTGEISSPSLIGNEYDLIIADPSGKLIRMGPDPGCCTPPAIPCFPWNVCGNTIGANHFIGSRNNMDVVFKTNDMVRMKIKNTGVVEIGQPPTLPGNYKLYVTGGILTEKLRVADPASTYWADFVFDKDYKLMSLKDLKKKINANHHLPGIPTTEDVKQNGIDVMEIQAKLLQKIEELTLYIIELDEKYEELKNIKEKCKN